MFCGNLDTANTGFNVLTIYKEHGEFIRKIIGQQLNDDYQADDIFQCLFLDLVIKSIPPGTECVHSYIHGAILNCIAEHRRRKICYEKYIEDYAESMGVVQNVPAPETELIAVEQTLKIFKLISKRLTPKEHRAITLRFRDAHKIHEIAKIMQVEAETVEHYISRALVKLRNPSFAKNIEAVSGYKFRHNITDVPIAETLSA